MLINIKSTGGGGGGESGREEGGKELQGRMAAELAQCHPFSGNATAPCDRGSGYMLRGPCARARHCRRAKGDYPDPQEQTAGSDRRRKCQDYRRGSSAVSPSSDAHHGDGAPPPAPHNSDFQHFFPPLDIIQPQWSQHNGCFHTLRDKGRRLRHDTTPFQAEAGILESLKINGKGKCEQ